MAIPAPKVIQPLRKTTDTAAANVFSAIREIKQPKIDLAAGLHFNKRLRMDGLHFLGKLDADTVPVAFFDPQYRDVPDKLNYDSEGKKRGNERSSIEQMSDEVISKFIKGINKALIPSGHLFLWMDKFQLCTGFHTWLDGTRLDIVDMMTWDKGKNGMGYRTLRRSEHLVILQKQPRRAKGIWKAHNIPDVWLGRVKRIGPTHQKPIDLQGELITAVSNEGDVVIDPAAGSFSVMEACRQKDRNFLGCDIKG